MPRDGSRTRSAIADAALALLREGGLPAFSVEGVSSRAQVAKGLVLYHYGSRARLIELCGTRVGDERSQRLIDAGTGKSGVAAIDAVWEELLRQHQDGTARAWLSLAAAGAIRTAPDDDVVAQARRMLLDGCAGALAAGAPAAGVREAYDALALALLRMEDES